MSSVFVPLNFNRPKFLAFVLSLALLRVFNSAILSSLTFLGLLHEVFAAVLIWFKVLVGSGGSGGGDASGDAKWEGYELQAA